MTHSNSSTHVERSHENDTTKNENTKEQWILPQGAEYIVRQIAAEQILFEILGDIFITAVVGQERASAKNDTKFEIVRRLAMEFPGTCQRVYTFKWEDGSMRELYPLAVLCCLRPPVNVVRAMHKGCPSAVTAVEASRASRPLHYACGFGASLEVIHFLVSVHPSSISSCRNDMVTPLHLACAYYKGGEPDLINFLLDEFPESAKQSATAMGWLPLHSAAHGGTHVSVIERLCKLYPESTTTADSKGRYPIHIACERKGNVEGVKCLISHAPELADLEDGSSFTPLSLAAMHQDLEVLKMLLEHTEVLEDNHGVTLLHMAAFQNTVEVIHFLVERYPFMIKARVRDSDMYTPLLAACRHDAPVDVVRALIRYDPSTLNMPDGEGRPPIDSARQAGADDAIIEVLQEELNAVAAKEFTPSLWPEPPSSMAVADPSSDPTIPDLALTRTFSSDYSSTSNVSSDGITSTI